MEYSKSGEQLTESFEGCRLTAYQDSTGIWTIAYGHTKGVTAGMICTQDQADQWLTEDIAFAVANVNRKVHIPLTQGEFDSMVDFDFNLGNGSLDSSTLLKLVNSGDFAAAANQFDEWDHAGGQVVAGLLRRRQAEEQEFLGTPASNS